MLKISIFLFFLLFAGAAFSQAPVKQLTERELLIKQIDTELGKSTVFECIRKFSLAVKRLDSDGYPLASNKYIPYKIQMKMFLKNRWFIADTGISKRWFSEVYKLLEYMKKTRDIIETAKGNHQSQTARTQQAVKYFDVAHKRFIKLIKKPVMVSSKIKRRAKLKKVLWQKAMLKKYKITKSENEGF